MFYDEYSDIERGIDIRPRCAPSPQPSLGGARRNGDSVVIGALKKVSEGHVLNTLRGYAPSLGHLVRGSTARCHLTTTILLD